MKKAIVLCSGGLDSVVTAHYVKKKLDFSELTLLFFDYGQRSLAKEREMVAGCAKELDAEFLEIRLDPLRELSHSLITVEKEFNETKNLSDTKEESANWYVPCRNLVFLSFAISLAESRFLEDGFSREIFTGFKNDGKETFPDASPVFVADMNRVAQCAKGDVTISVPLIEKDKEDIVLLGKEFGVDFTRTFSCYVGKEKHCGKCLACKLRQQGFHWANVDDPSDYE